MQGLFCLEQLIVFDWLDLPTSFAANALENVA